MPSARDGPPHVVPVSVLAVAEGLEARATRVAARLARAPTARPRHVLLGAAAFGVALGEAPVGGVAAIAAVGSALIAAAREPRLALLLAAAVLGGWGIGHARLAAIDAPGERLRAGDRVVGNAYLLEHARPGRFGTSAELRMISGGARGARLLARAAAGVGVGGNPGVTPVGPRGAAVPAQRGGGGRGGPLAGGRGGPLAGGRGGPLDGGPGTEVRLVGTLRRPRHARPGAFDITAHLRRQGVAGELTITHAYSTGRRRGGLAGAVDAARQRAERAIGAGLPAPRAALARGMVLGQDDAIDPTVRDDFRASGLAHVLAVSGQNVVLLAGLALALLSAAGVAPATRMAVAIALIALYVPLAGAGPSLQRAGVMGAASLAALALARPASRWYALLLAAAATLLLNPRAWGDPGWQLSFAAVVGILTLAPRLAGGPLRSLPRLLAEGVALTLAATLATAPLLAYHFGTVSLAGLPANVLALPLVAPIMWLGILRGAAGQLSPAGAVGFAGHALSEVVELVNAALGLALSPLTGALLALARWFAELPGGQVGWSASVPVVVLSYVALGAAAFGVARTARRAEPSLAETAARWRRRSRMVRVAAVCVSAGAAALLLVRAAAAPSPPDALTVSFLDVGQGDATLVQHPDGTAVLFDGGPPEGRAARLLHRSGVRRLSAVVMTHASRDHHGGLREVVERYPVDLLVDGGDGTRDGAFRETVALAVRRGARRVVAVSPMTLRAGALTVRVLSPSSRPGGPVPEDPNPRAVVAVVSGGEFDLLLSADAESPTLAGLALPDVDAIKVPHHGSADPGLPQLLERLRPEVASVPVGPNPYGHPAPSTLAALRRAGVELHRTDREGTVRLIVRAGSMSVSSER